jgi:putative DNA primase/helicase
MVEIFGEQKPTDQADTPPVDNGLSVEEIVERILDSAHADEINALFNGDISAYGDDHSAADPAFCNHMAFFTEKNPKPLDSNPTGSVPSGPKL